MQTTIQTNERQCLLTACYDRGHVRWPRVRWMKRADKCGHRCSFCTHSTEGCYEHDIVQIKWEYQNRSYIHMTVIKWVVDIYPRDCLHGEGSIESALCILLFGTVSFL